MAKKDENNKVQTVPEDAKVETAQPPKDEPKKEEPKKEIWIVRAAKAVWTGGKKVKNAVNGFVHEHPYATAGLTAAAGVGGKMLFDHFIGDDSEDSAEAAQYLPEPQEEPFEIDFVPEDEAAESEVEANDE